MKIGIVGGGVVGRATAHAYKGWADEVRVFDVVRERRTHAYEATLLCDLVFVCLPEAAVEPFFREVHPHHNYVLKSTVPVGTTRRLAERYALVNLVHSPEFLTERCALVDALTPRANVIGYVADLSGADFLATLYRHRFPGVPVQVMTCDESEAVKLMTNAYAATAVGLFNEFRSLADARGLDWSTVLAGLLAQGRIPHEYTRVPGPDGKRGWGGRCLPKDLDTLIGCYAETPNVFAEILYAVRDRNDEDRER